MAFVYSMFDDASKELGIVNPLVKTGGCLWAWNHATANHVKAPQAHDIFIIDHGNGLGHTGMVESVEGNIIHTIEGNSNSDGSRNGVAVVRHSRQVSDPLIIGYLRY